MSNDQEIPEPSPEEKIEVLKREVELLHRELQRRNNQMLGFPTVLYLPISTKRRLEIGFIIVKDLADETLKAIIGRCVKEASRSEMTFDDIIDPLVRTIGFERVWGHLVLH
ncbi:MAG: hypothetical protein WBE34_15940 [Candidatus Nitrosopolaris sp.]